MYLLCDHLLGECHDSSFKALGSRSKAWTVEKNKTTTSRSQYPEDGAYTLDRWCGRQLAVSPPSSSIIDFEVTVFFIFQCFEVLGSSQKWRCCRYSPGPVGGAVGSSGSPVTAQVCFRKPRDWFIRTSVCLSVKNPQYRQRPALVSSSVFKSFGHLPGECFLFESPVMFGMFSAHCLRKSLLYFSLLSLHLKLRWNHLSQEPLQLRSTFCFSFWYALSTEKNKLQNAY